MAKLSVRKTNIQGISLLEVLIALFILSIGTITSHRTLLALESNTLYLQKKQWAQWASHNKIIEIQIQKRKLPLGTSIENCPIGEWNMVCHYLIEKTPNPTFHKITLQTQYENQTLAEVSVVISTMLQK